MTVPQETTVAASGMVLWRRQRSTLQVLLVHRPKYNDWAWPKGKLDPGEDWMQAAVREVTEETGLRGRVGIPLPDSSYPLRNGDLKQVKYWAGRPVGGSGVLENEIDQVAWLSAGEAHERLSYVRDSVQLQAVLDADRQGLLDTWPLLIVRHADAVARSEWDCDDRTRPLSQAGATRAEEVAGLLAAYAPTRLITSPAVRCTDTIGPYAAAAGIAPSLKFAISEEGFAQDPRKVVRRMAKVFEAAEPTVLCSHRPLLPTMLLQAAGHAVPGSLSATTLQGLAASGLEKGEVIACQVAGIGDSARIVSIERHRP
ncbi:NUDIX hydrolase [Calidifontibacter terrae]